MPPSHSLDESTLSDRERAALAFFRTYSAEHKRPPSIREVGDHLGLPHPNNANRVLDKLEAEGFIVRGEPDPGGRPRVLRVAFGEERKRFSLPILGIISCGPPMAVGDPSADRFDFESWCGEDTYLVEARGDSMIDEHISPGDFIVVRRQSDAEFGEKVVCMIDGEMTLKIYRENRGAKWLFPCNPDHQPIRLEANKDNVIIGVAAGVIRRFRRPKSRNRKG